MSFPYSFRYSNTFLASTSQLFLRDIVCHVLHLCLARKSREEDGRFYLHRCIEALTVINFKMFKDQNHQLCRFTDC